MASICHLGFYTFKFWTQGLYAPLYEFHAYRSNHCGYMAVFQFRRMPAIHHLGLFTRREAIASPSTWRDFKAHFDGLHGTGYNSAESERIWVKFGTLWAKCWGLAMADFGRDPRSSDSLRGNENFVFFGHTDNTRFHRFPVRQFSRILHTTMSIGVAV